jgi:hypothetical protein
LICESEGWFAKQCEHNLGLVTLRCEASGINECTKVKARTFMDVLMDSLAMANLGRWKWVHGKSQVGNSRFAKLLLVSDGGDCEVPWLFLKQGEGGNFGFLCVGFAVDAIAV